MKARQIEMVKATEPVAYRIPNGPMKKRHGFSGGNLRIAIPLALLVFLVVARSSWVAQFLLVLLLLTIPGVILLRALRIPGTAIALFPVYVPCASLVVLLGSALAVDVIGPNIGVAAPLRPWPMLVGLELVCLILLIASLNAPPEAAIPWRSLPRPGQTAMPLILSAVAAAGALRLNSGHGNGVALVALLACILTVMATFVLAPRLHTGLLAGVLYAAGLAMLWSFELRGDSVYGFDISTEYYILQQTVQTGIWHTVHPNNAYAAMLSTTVLPAEMHALTGVPALLVFKVIYPAICALIPVGVFFLARRLLSSRWAFAAGALMIAQSSFGQSLPQFARQEPALVLFTALLAAMLEVGLPRRVQWPLVILFAIAMAMSHYSSTYIAIILLAVASIFRWIISWFLPVSKVSRCWAVAFMALGVSALIWYGAVTHSGSNFTSFVQAAREQGVDFLPNRAQGEGLLASYINGNTETPLPAGQYAQLVHNEYVQSVPYVHPLAAASNPQYSLRDSTIPEPQIGSAVVYNFFGLSAAAGQQLIYLVAAVGALILVLRRTVPAIAREIGLLALAALVFLIAIRLSGTLAYYYNSTRALLQGMILLDIPLFWCVQALAARRRFWQVGVIVASAALIIVIFATGYSLVGAILGGGTTSNLANNGEDFDQFYVTAPELASASWLGSQIRQGQLVYADKYAQLRLVSVTGISSGLLMDVTPETISIHAWVYADRTNVLDEQALVGFDNRSVSYVFPSQFLEANYNLVYTNGSSEVYHR